MRRQGLPHAKLPEAIQLYHSGWSTEKIGKHLGCDAETIRQNLIRAGVTMRGPHDRPKA
jgi:hypothetical protein